MPHLERRVADPSTSAHERAVGIEALVRMKDRADPEELQRCVTSPRAGVRLLACGIVAALDARQEAALIEPLLTDPTAEVRASALTALGLVGHPISADLVTQLSQDSSPQVAITTGWYLLLHGRPEGATLLRSFVTQKEGSWRRLAAAAIAQAGAAGLPLAQELLNRDDPSVRLQLACTLLHHRTAIPRAAAVLAQQLTDPVTRWAVDATSHPLFHPILPAELVAAQREPGFREPGFMEQSDARVRLELWRELAYIDHPEAISWVRRFMASRDPNLIAGALEILMEEEPTPLDALRPLLTDSDAHIRTIGALLCAFVARDPSVLPLLQENYAAAPRPLQLATLEAMTLLGDPSSLPFLQRCLLDPSPLTRVVAASANIRCMNQ